METKRELAYGEDEEPRSTDLRLAAETTNRRRCEIIKKPSAAPTPS